MVDQSQASIEAASRVKCERDSCVSPGVPQRSLEQAAPVLFLFFLREIGVNDDVSR